MTCSQCRNSNSQMYYCFDCGHFICPDCNNKHEMLRASFKGHNVRPVKEFKEEDYEALLKRQPFCSQPYHEKHITKFFCFSCDVCVCDNCRATEHQSHKIGLLDQAAHDEKPKIMAGAERIKEKKNELREVIRQFKRTSSELERNFADAEREVSEAAKRMIEKIQESERDALASLRAKRKTRQENITLAEKEANSLMKQIDQAVEFADNLTERSSSSDIMSNKDTLKQRNEQLCGVEVPKHHQTTFIKFSAASVNDFKLGVIENTETKAGENQFVPASAHAEGQWPCRLV